MKRQPKDRNELSEEQRYADLGAVLSIPAGRRFLFDLLERRCDLRGMAPPGTDGLMIQGRRALAIALNEDARVKHPKLYRTMWNEGLDAEVEEQIHRDAAKTADQLESDE